MAVILSIILATITYLGGGWCIYNVYLSINPICDSDTIQSIYSTQLLVYAITSCVINAIAIGVADGPNNNLESWAEILPLAPLAVCIVFGLLPISEGGAILNTVICIIISSICIYQWLKSVL